MLVLAYSIYTSGLRYALTLPEIAFSAALTSVITVTFGAYLFFPALIAIVIAELLALRSLVYWLLAGGLFGLLPGFLPQFWQAAGTPNRVFVPFVAAGFVWGLVYWLIAGRLAGGGVSRAPPPGSA